MKIDLEKLEELETFEPIKTKPEKRSSERASKKTQDVRPVADIEKAVWQYLIDHSTPNKLGYAVSFIARSRDDFFRRVEARRNGDFKRVEQRKIEAEVKKITRNKKWTDKRSDAYTVALKEGAWWLKLAIKLRKKLTIFIDKHSMALAPTPIKK